MVPQVTVSTKNILFICGGAFPELDEIIKERLNQQSSIGFAADLKDKYDEDPNLLQQVTLEDLRNFGMIPEFLGRLPIIFSLENLTKDMLVKIMKEPRNAILKQYEKLLELDEVKLEFADDALEAIAQKQWRKRPERVHCGPFWKIICWILCMKFQRTTISEQSLSQAITLKDGCAGNSDARHGNTGTDTAERIKQADEVNP